MLKFLAVPTLPLHHYSIYLAIILQKLGQSIESELLF